MVEVIERPKQELKLPKLTPELLASMESGDPFTAFLALGAQRIVPPPGVPIRVQKIAHGVYKPPPRIKFTFLIEQCVTLNGCLLLPPAQDEGWFAPIRGGFPITETFGKGSTVEFSFEDVLLFAKQDSRS